MNRTLLTFAGTLGFSAVALGAFGAHGLKARVSPEALGQWKTGVEYQFYHGLALLVLAGWAAHLSASTLRILRVLFIAGVICFSGSIYLLSTREIMHTEALTPVLGPATPIGGLLLLTGWGLLLFKMLRGAEDR